MCSFRCSREDLVKDRFELEGTFTRDHVADVRRFTERLLAWIPDPDLRSRMAIATHELFENAIKFSDDGTAALLIEMERAPKLLVRIITRNRAKEADLMALHKLEANMREAEDAMALYVALMKAAPDARGGLGIGRVAAESEMKVSMQFDGDVVQISAETMDL